jgi:heat shock protein HslJ
VTRYRLAAALAALLLAAACSDSADTSTTASSSTTTLPLSVVVGTWLLDGISVAGEPYPIPVDHPRNAPDIAAPAMFEFTSDGSLNGWGLCNNFRAEYEFDGRVFTFHDGYFQLLLCSDTPGLNEAEEVIFTVVRSADVTVTVTSDGTVMQLSLRSTALTLHRAPES